MVVEIDFNFLASLDISENFSSAYFVSSSRFEFYHHLTLLSILEFNLRFLEGLFLTSKQRQLQAYLNITDQVKAIK